PIDHHYLPQFYLKNFAFTFKKKNYRLYVYDKIHENKISPKTTKEICYEKNRNTLDLHGEKDYFIEKSLGELEGVMAEFVRLTLDYEKLIKNRTISNKSVLDRSKYLPFSYKIKLRELLDIPYYARIFNYIISVFYWRLTINDSYFIQKMGKTTLSESINNILSENKSIPADISDVHHLLSEMREEIISFESLIDHNSIIKIYKSLIHPAKNIFRNPNNKNLILLRTTFSVISSDFPFCIFDNEPSLDDRFIFIWSPNVIFINNINLDKIDIREFCFKLSLLNYLSAKRYVFSNDKELLNNVICYANMKYNDGDTKKVKDEILKTLTMNKI
ncbi:DUF4238 domain-containing protein, partial [Klebsiella pneumoniae]